MAVTRLSDIQAYQSPWLKASDLQGRPVAVVVEKVTVEDIRQQNGLKEARVVVDFRGKAKRLICNKTQGQAFADIASTEELARWVGLSVILAPATTRSGQATINIRPATQSGAPAGDNPFDDDSPAGAMPAPKKALIDPKVGG